MTGHTYLTVKNYLKEDCSANNRHYDRRMPGKLAPYEQTVIEMRSQGIAYNKIHECICKKGYTGTIASLRVFMQKERTHQKSISQNMSEPVEYIPRKCLCQLIYRELETVNGLTNEQYEATLKKYPILVKSIQSLENFTALYFQTKALNWTTGLWKLNNYRLMK